MYPYVIDTDNNSYRIVRIANDVAVLESSIKVDALNNPVWEKVVVVDIFNNKVLGWRADLSRGQCELFGSLTYKIATRVL